MGKMKYIVERDYQLPLCAVVDDGYMDFNYNPVIEKNAIKFINDGLKRHYLKTKILDFSIYGIREKSKPLYQCYIYHLNGHSNYFDRDKRLLSNNERQYIIDHLISGDYVEEVVWNGI